MLGPARVHAPSAFAASRPDLPLTLAQAACAFRLNAIGISVAGKARFA